MLLAFFLLQVLGVAGQTPMWATEGGDWQRTNSFFLNLPLLAQQLHTTYTYGEPEEDTVSEVETCSDLFYPVPRHVSEQLSVVTFVSSHLILLRQWSLK